MTMIEIAKKENTFSVVKIKDVSFSVNEKLYSPDLKKVLFKLNQTLGVNIENNLINLTLTVVLHYEDATPEQALASISVENIFEVENLQSLNSKTGIVFPNGLLISMMSVSVAHTRTLFSRNLAGTFLDNIVMPITDPEELARSFYPNSFPKLGKPKAVRKDRKAPLRK